MGASAVRLLRKYPYAGLLPRGAFLPRAGAAAGMRVTEIDTEVFDETNT